MLCEGCPWHLAWPCHISTIAGMVFCTEILPVWVTICVHANASYGSGSSAEPDTALCLFPCCFPSGLGCSQPYLWPLGEVSGEDATPPGREVLCTAVTHLGRAQERCKEKPWEQPKATCSQIVAQCGYVMPGSSPAYTRMITRPL